VDHFIAKHAKRAGKRIDGLAPGVIEALQSAEWPGNVRELENAVERAVVLSRGNTIMPEHLPLAAAPTSAGGRARSRRAAEKNGEGADAEEAAANGSGNGEHPNGAFKVAVESLEKKLIAEALERHHGNRSKAAEELGIYRRLLYAKMREYGLGE
jgi:DNA-binding NtrC family response regulator